jgi:hypothetical protein
MEECDIYSVNFNAEAALRRPEQVYLPYPDMKPLNNVSQFKRILYPEKPKEKKLKAPSPKQTQKEMPQISNFLDKLAGIA